MQCACAIQSSVACPVLQYFPYYLINGTIFPKTLVNTKCVFLFSLQGFSDIFLILRTNARDMIKKCLMVFIPSTRHSYPILIKLEFSGQFFEVYSNTKFHENPSSGRRAVSCGRTDMTKIIVAFRIPSISDLLPEASTFQHHTKPCSKCSILLVSSSNLTPVHHKVHHVHPLNVLLPQHRD